MMDDMDQAIRDYLQDLKLKRYRPRTIGTQKNALKQFNAFLSAHQRGRVCDITEADVEMYRRKVMSSHLALNTVVSYLTAIQSLFKYLEDRQELFINPAASLIIPIRKRRLQPVPTEDEVKKILARPDVSTPSGIRDRALLETLYGSGVRVTELRMMDIYDVNLKQGLARVLGKGEKERMVPLSRLSIFWTNAYLNDVRPGFAKHNPGNPALWMGPRGSRLHLLSIERNIHDYGIKAGIKCPVTPHALRRACATHMLRNGAHPAAIQMLLGHATLESLSHYLKITITDMIKTHSRGKVGK